MNLPPMSDDICGRLIASVAFYFIALLGWFFSSRRKTFIRTFCLADGYRDALGSLPRGDDFRKGMRIMAALQSAVATIYLVGTLIAWLRG